MKRHDCFIPLSREHHDGLLLAVRLQQGTRALLRLWSHDPVWQAEYVVKFFRENLMDHFQTEEKEIFPLVERYFPPQNSGMAAQLRNEHLEMKTLVESMSASGESQLAPALVKFGTALERHIHTEERELFPLCERYFPEDILKQLGTSIASAHNKGGQP